MPASAPGIRAPMRASSSKNSSTSPRTCADARVAAARDALVDRQRDDPHPVGHARGLAAVADDDDVGLHPLLALQRLDGRAQRLRAPGRRK